jgi:hypothetical protein
MHHGVRVVAGSLVFLMRSALAGQAVTGGADSVHGVPRTARVTGTVRTEGGRPVRRVRIMVTSALRPAYCTP